MVILMIYFIGYVIAYIVLKKSWLFLMRQDGKWTIQYRNLALLMALISWISVLTCLWNDLITRILSKNKNNTEAKW